MAGDEFAPPAEYEDFGSIILRMETAGMYCCLSVLRREVED
jgi:hypothetical protein